MNKSGKVAIKVLSIIIVVIILIIAFLLITGKGYVFRAVSLTLMKGYKTTNIDDHTDFKNNIIEASTPTLWELHDQYNQIELTDTLRKELENFKTIGYVIIKDGKLLYEEYWDDYSNMSLTNSFSMAKTVVTMLLGKAIEQGYIKNLQQPITDFIPEFKSDSLGRLCTVGDLSAMTSGFDWNEEYYSPINPTTESYFTNDIEKMMLKRRFVTRPGGYFKYSSADTQLLAIVLKRALGMSISEYLSQEFWKPMGMEQDAFWSKDWNGEMEKAFCCLNSNVRDFAKLGQLILQKGHWQGQQLLDSAFIEKMVTPKYKAFKNDEPKKYGYSIWIDEEHIPAFYGFMGHLGQRIIIIPSENTVIVRLGKIKDTRPMNKGHLDNDTYYFVDETVKILRNNNL